MSASAVLPFQFQPNQNALALLAEQFADDDTADGAYLADTLDMALQQGMNPLAVVQYLTMFYNPAHAEAIARTDMLGAYRGAALNTYRDNSDVVGNWMWSAAAGACVACMEEDGTIHDLTEDLDSMTHMSCFPGEVLVSGPRALGSTTRWYEGEIVEIETARGYVLPVTPNHPILTPQGWVAAGQLHEGGNVISRLRRDGCLAARVTSPDDHQVEARIEQVAHTLGGEFEVSAVRMPTAAEDFHGDGADSQVHVIRTYRSLRNRVHAARHEPITQQQLLGRRMSLQPLARLGALYLLLQRSNATESRAMRRLGVTASFLRRAPRIAETVRGRLVAYGDTGHTQARPNHRARDAEGFGKSILRFASLIAAHDLSICDASVAAVGRSAALSGQPIARRLIAEQPALSQVSRQSPLAYVIPSSDSLRAFAGDVGPDRILKVSRRRFSGHVYNLQTAEQWYLANQIIAHNCRCSPIPVTVPWSDILGPLGIDVSDIEETSIVDDYVPMSETWDQLSFEEQAAALGSKSAAEAVSRGLLEPADFVGHIEGGPYDGALYTKSLREALADAKGMSKAEIAATKRDLLSAVRNAPAEEARRGEAALRDELARAQARLDAAQAQIDAINARLAERAEGDYVSREEMHAAQVEYVTARREVERLGGQPAFAAARETGVAGARSTYTLTADDRAFVQALKDTIPEGGITTADDAVQLGQQVRARVEDDLADVKAYAQEAADIRAIAPNLTDEQRAWALGEPDAVAAHNGYHWAGPHSAEEAYRDAYQAQMRAYLSEIRDTGGVDLKLADRPTTPPYWTGPVQPDVFVAERLAAAAEQLPSDWLQASNDLGEIIPIRSLATNSAGMQQSLSDGRSIIELRYSKKGDPVSYEATLLHELVHRMEAVLPQLSDMEQAYYDARTADESFVRLTNGIGQNTKLDAWLDQYLGREPLDQARPVFQLADGTYRYATKSYELLTMGAEMLFAPGTDAATFALWADSDYANFVLGAFMGVRADAEGVIAAAGADATAAGDAVFAAGRGADELRAPLTLTHDDINWATEQAWGNQNVNDTFRVEGNDGALYFGKRAPDWEQIHQLAAQDIYGLMGAGDQIVAGAPLGTDATTTIYPFVEQKTLLDMTRPEQMAALHAGMSEEDAWRLTFSSYLMGDEDRHMGQFIQLTDGRVVAVDFGKAFLTNGVGTPYGSMLAYWYGIDPANEGHLLYELHIPQEALDGIRAHAEELRGLFPVGAPSAPSTIGVVTPEAQLLDSYLTRLRILERLAELPDPTYNDWDDIAREERRAWLQRNR